MMIKQITDRELLSGKISGKTGDLSDLRWRRDREDVYILCDATRAEQSMGRNLFYEPYEIRCNPDFDF